MTFLPGLTALVVAFCLSGFAIRMAALVPAARGWPSAAEALLGYGLVGFSGLLSLAATGSPGAGVWSCGVLAIVGLVRSWPDRPRGIPAPTPAAGVKILFVAAVATLYGPLLLGFSGTFRFPDVFDLPKQVSATVAAAHANGWPAPNPYFPDLPFAYNLLFYLPLGYAGALFQNAALFPSLVAFAAVWTTWQMVDLLDSMMSDIGVGGPWRLAGLLMATFVAGLTPLLVDTTLPLGVKTMMAGLTPTWVDEPFVLFVYVPQHIFAAACGFTACRCLTAWSGRVAPAMGAALATACGALASFILAPILLLSFALIALVEWVALGERERWRSWRAAFPALAVLSLVFPFLVQASRWGGAAGGLVLRSPLHEGWGYLALGFGMVLPAGVAGLFAMARVHRRAAARFAGLLLPSILMLASTAEIDFALKSSTYLRFALVPPAAFGLSALYPWLCARLGSVAPALTGGLLGFGTLSGLLVIGGMTVTAFVPRDPLDRAVVAQLRALPFAARVLFRGPSQEHAAAAGHLVYMDERVYRPDAYLPERHREMALKTLQQYIEQQCPPSTVRATWEPGAPDLLRSESVGTGKAPRDLLAELQGRWVAWPTDARLAATREGNTITLATAALGDVALTAPIRFERGVYRLSLTFEGEVQGHAHISIHGDRKLLDIPAGIYPAGSRLTAPVTVGDSPEGNQLAIGFGGWAVGAGRLVVSALELGAPGNCAGDRP